MAKPTIDDILAVIADAPKAARDAAKSHARFYSENRHDPHLGLATRTSARDVRDEVAALATAVGRVAKSTEFGLFSVTAIKLGIRPPSGRDMEAIGNTLKSIAENMIVPPGAKHITPDKTYAVAEAAAAVAAASLGRKAPPATDPEQLVKDFGPTKFARLATAFYSYYSRSFQSLDTVDYPIRKFRAGKLEHYLTIEVQEPVPGPVKRRSKN